MEIRGQSIEVEIADTPSSWVLGLSNREPLRPDQGMVFLYAGKSLRSFWMKEMRFGLDIIWFDGDRVVKIDRNVPPEGSRPSVLYDSGVPVDRVLEVNAGSSDRWGIKIGDRALFLLP